MVTNKEKIIASAFSAAIIGGVHYFAHKLAPTYYPDNQVMFVGTVVVISVFFIAYWGMGNGATRLIKKVM